MTSPSTALPYPDYLDHIRAESARFREVLASTDPAARVPTCPDWTATDLLWHLGGEVQHFWDQIVRLRPAGPDSCAEAARPDRFPEVLASFDRIHADFVAALEAADPADVAWSWSADHTVGFTLRRQAHEALIHRVDAELTAGVVTPLDPRLAADGVHEALAVMFGGTPQWGSFDPRPQHLRFDLRDTDTQLWVQLGTFSGTSPEGEEYAGEPHLDVVPDPGHEPDVVVEGLAGAVDAWLWRRRDDSGIDVLGDPQVYAAFRTRVDQPIE